MICEDNKGSNVDLLVELGKKTVIASIANLAILTLCEKTVIASIANLAILTLCEKTVIASIANLAILMLCEKTVIASMAEPTSSSTTPAAPPDSNPTPMATDNVATQLDPASASSLAPNHQPQSSVPPPPNPSLTPGPTNNIAGTPSAFPSTYGLPPPPPMYGAPLQPSFRPVAQFTTLQNYQNAVGVQPPGVGGAGTATANTAPPGMPHYQVQPGQYPNPILRPPYASFPNGYPGATPQGIMPPPGIPRFPSHFPGMIRPSFHPRPPGAPGLLPMARPMVPNIPGVRPFIPPIIRPAVPSVTPAEKPQTTVYVGKISPSVKNDFMLPLLQSCGLVKSWKRAEDPSDGTPRGFGFCEFENAEGILRALRLLSKFNIDGQELVLNVNQATREYLDRYVEKKTENSKNLKEGAADKQDTAPTDAESSEKTEPAKSSADDSENDDGKDDKASHDLAKFGIVTDEDKEGDRAAMEKITDMIEERIKTRPLPPPPPPPPLLPTDGSFNPHIEQIKSQDGDSDIDGTRNDASEEKNNDETSSEYKAAIEHDRSEVTSPDRNRRYDRRSRDVKHEKEREMERYEREAERERVRKEREQRRKVDDAEREYEERLRDWEYREREKEKQRQYEKEKEKERERKRRKEILRDEEDKADEESGKRWRRSVIEEKRRKRRQEKEDDLADKVKEEEEIAEAEKRAKEEKLLQEEKEVLKVPSPTELANGSDKAASPDEMVIERGEDVDSVDANHTGDERIQNGADVALSVTTVDSEAHQENANAPTRKLGFGLLGAGKRANVPSVFHEEEDDAHKDKKMRPLVPIDYSTEELEAVQPVTTSGTQPANLVAAAEYAKQISNIAPREERSEGERDNKRQRSHDRPGRRDENSNRSREDSRKKSDRERDRDRDHDLDKVKTPDKQKLLDAKQLIDMIPKTKDELFSYEVNWAVYDKHALHDRMRPWISKKVTEFLGEEETTLVDYIVSSTKEHVKAAQMLEMLQSILDDEAEMFVLKMWRMLIFEVKKVETGLALKSK